MRKQEKMDFSTGKQDEMDFLAPLNFYSFFQQKNHMCDVLTYGVLVWGIYTPNIPFEHKTFGYYKKWLFLLIPSFFGSISQKPNQKSTNSLLNETENFSIRHGYVGHMPLFSNALK